MITDIPSNVDHIHIKKYIRKIIEKTYPSFKNPINNEVFP
jgi:hypothetical protein